MKQRLILLPIMLVFYLVCLPLPATATGISGLRVEHKHQRERIVLKTSKQLVHHKVFHLDKPDRLVIDFPKVPFTKLGLPESYNGSLIKAIRFGEYSKGVVRMVLDVHRPVQVLASYAVPPSDNSNYWRYVIDIEGDDPRANIPVVVAEKKVEIPLIVIDAGHGGRDPGAIGRSHSREKHLTLRYAKALQKALLKTRRYRVKLTRSDDTYLLLKERVSMARAMHGDLFISLHADSNSRSSARGFSVYTLSETASDDEAAALAAQENKADVIDGIDLNIEDEDVASILIDLAQRETLNKSSVLANTIIANLHKKVIKLPNPHRYAGFRVLKAPDIPSVLIELGFLSNKHDEKMLNTREYENIISYSLTKAIDAYFRKQPGAV